MVCGVFRATGKSCMATEPAIHDRRARFLHAAVLGVTTSTRHRTIPLPSPQRPYGLTSWGCGLVTHLKDRTETIPASCSTLPIRSCCREMNYTTYH